MTSSFSHQRSQIFLNADKIKGIVAICDKRDKLMCFSNLCLDSFASSFRWTTALPARGAPVHSQTQAWDDPEVPPNKDGHKFFRWGQIIHLPEVTASCVPFYSLLPVQHGRGNVSSKAVTKSAFMSVFTSCIFMIWPAFISWELDEKKKEKKKITIRYTIYDVITPVQVSFPQVVLRNRGAHVAACTVKHAGLGTTWLDSETKTGGWLMSDFFFFFLSLIYI